MRKYLITIASAAMLAFAASPADAAEMDYGIFVTGGSGSLGGTPFNNRFFLLLGTGNTRNLNDNGVFSEINPLDSAVIALFAVGDIHFTIPTRIGIAGSTVFFSRGNNGEDLIDLSLAAPIDLKMNYELLSATLAYNLSQFKNVETDRGLFSLDSVSNLKFFIGTLPSPPAVPEPTSWMMMIAGFGLIGSMMRRVVPAFVGAPPIKAGAVPCKLHTGPR